MTLTVAVAPYVAPSPAHTVTVTASPVVTARLTVTRIHEDASEWPLILPAGPRLVGGMWTGVDYLAPFGQFVTYRADTSTQTATSAPWPIVSARSWLIHPIDPDLSTIIDQIRGLADRTFPDRAVRLDILGSAAPVHRFDSPPSLETGELTVRCDTPTAWRRVEALVTSGWPLLLNTTLSGYGIRWLWIQPKAPRQAAPPHDAFDMRFAVIPFEGTAQPAVAGQGTWTYGDLKARYQGRTWADLGADYSSNLNLKLDVQG